MKINIKPLSPEALMPTYATDGSGCFDIYSTERFIILPNSFQVFSTKLAFEIPEGWVMLLFSRSGHGFKDDVRLGNCVGVIDSDYRGEVKVKLTSDSNYKSMIVKKGDRICQGMLTPVEKVEFEFVESLSTTDRGEKGFGSTG